MCDYSKSKIYKISSKKTDKVYIGSTTSSLGIRFSLHKYHYKLFLQNKKSYISSFELLKYDDCKISLIENCACENKNELKKIEQKYLELNNCVNINNALNKLTPNERAKIYYYLNKDRVNQLKKIYYDKNKEKLKDYGKNYREKNKDKLAQYKIDNKEKIAQTLKNIYERNKQERLEYRKKHYQENKEKILQYHKKRYQDKKEEIQKQHKNYYQKNKEKLKMNNKKVSCICGSNILNSSMSSHLKSKKHLTYLQNNKI